MRFVNSSRSFCIIAIIVFWKEDYTILFARLRVGGPRTSVYKHYPIHLLIIVSTWILFSYVSEDYSRICLSRDIMYSIEAEKYYLDRSLSRPFIHGELVFNAHDGFLYFMDYALGIVMVVCCLLCFLVLFRVRVFSISHIFLGT